MTRDASPWSAWIVFGVCAALYFTTYPLGSDGMVLGNDALGYARAAAHAEPIASAGHHAAFHPLTHVLARVFSFGAPTTLDVLRAQVLVSSLGGALAASFLFTFARRRMGAARALVATCFFAFASSTWIYAGSGETTLPAAAALAGVLTRALPRAPRAGTSARATNDLVLGAWLVAALALRVDSVLVVPALMFALPARRWLPLILASSVAALAIHAACWAAAAGDATFVAWMSGLARDPAFETGFTFARLGLACGAVGVALSYLVWTHAWLGLAALATALAALWPTRSLGRFALRATPVLSVFIVTRIVFFAWWQPGNIEFHAPTVWALAALAAVLVPGAAEDGATWRRSACALASLALVIGGNAWTFVVPLRGDALARDVREALDEAGEGGLVVALDGLTHFALLREDRAGVEWIDASAVTADHVAARVGDVHGRGLKVVLMRERRLASHFGWAQPELDLGRLTPGLDVHASARAEGPPWLWIATQR